jgi:hypothetical protein
MRGFTFMTPKELNIKLKNPKKKRLSIRTDFIFLECAYSLKRHCMSKSYTSFTTTHAAE